MKELLKDKLTRRVIIITLIVIIFGIQLIRIYNSIGNTPNYDVYVYDDGSAQVIVDNVNYINQLPDGTLIIEGGSPEEYLFPRHDYVKKPEE